MKQSLDEESIKSMIKYRLNRANETLHEAQILLKEECYNATVNRLYYACYYAVSALLINNNIQAQTHSGVKQMFGLHFIANNKLPRRLNIIYSNLFDKRHSCDYDDFIYYDYKTVSSLLPEAKEVIDSIKEYLNI